MRDDCIIMKFGKQLELGTYKPWRNYYISYGRLKRVIFRLVFYKSLRDGAASNLGSRTHSFIELPPSGGNDVDIITVPSAYNERDTDPLDDSTHAETKTKEKVPSSPRSPSPREKRLGYQSIWMAAVILIATANVYEDYGSAGNQKKGYVGFKSMDSRTGGPRRGD